MFQAKVRRLQNSRLHPAYYSEEFTEHGVYLQPGLNVTDCYFIGSVEDFNIFKGWLLTQDSINIGEVTRLESLDSPVLSLHVWSQTSVTYFTKVDPCSHKKVTDDL